MVSYGWRSPFENAEVSALHAAAFGHRPVAEDWQGQLLRHSLGWVCARQDDALVGFVKVIWDGGVHAFVLDTIVAPALHGQGIGTALVAVAEREARAAGCEWLHVDFEDHLRDFYFRGCGFRPTNAGLIALRRSGSQSAPAV
ncbi:MAG TPA: GNAT family N-acetyltransferase [Streptosporangiaceae bacterium]